MRKYAENHPIVFEIILTVIAFVLAIVFSFVGQIMYFSNEISIAIGRILAGALLLLLSIRCVRFKKQFSGIVKLLPGILFVLWNVINCFLSGGSVTYPDEFTIILCLAPAIFEEVLFRAIFIHNLKKSGKSDMTTMLISAIFFGLIHVTNIVSGQVLQTLLQVAYATVIGMVLGAVYVKSWDLISVMILHFCIDFSNAVFTGGGTTPVYLLVAFVLLLAAEAFYAVYLVRKD